MAPAICRFFAGRCRGSLQRCQRVTKVVLKLHKATAAGSTMVASAAFGSLPCLATSGSTCSTSCRPHAALQAFQHAQRQQHTQQHLLRSREAVVAQASRTDAAAAAAPPGEEQKARLASLGGVVTDAAVPEGHKGLHGFLYGEGGAEQHDSRGYVFRHVCPAAAHDAVGNITCTPSCCRSACLNQYVCRIISIGASLRLARRAAMEQYGDLMKCPPLQGEDDGKELLPVGEYLAQRDGEKPIGVYAVYDAWEHLQYVGYSRNIVLAVKVSSAELLLRPTTSCDALLDSPQSPIAVRFLFTLWAWSISIVQPHIHFIVQPHIRVPIFAAGPPGGRGRGAVRLREPHGVRQPRDGDARQPRARGAELAG